jgi:hypothetical protein
MRRLLTLTILLLVGCSSVAKTTMPPDMQCTSDYDCWCLTAPLPTITLTPPNIDFGTVAVGASADATLTLTNTGTTQSPTPWGEFGPGIDNTPSFEDVGSNQQWPGDTGTCRHPLAPGETCTVVLTFAPSRAFNYSGNYWIYYAGRGICGGTGGSGGGPQPPLLTGMITGHAI